VAMFESEKKHFNHGVTGFNINLSDSSPNQVRCYELINVRIEILGTAINPDAWNYIHTKALRQTSTIEKKEAKFPSLLFFYLSFSK
jgi:hypothetical protein